MNKIMKFDNTNINIIEENGEPLFEVYSTGMALGQVKKNARGVLYPRKDRIEENLKNADIQPCVRNGHRYISESQLYDLMLEVKTDRVKPFRKWVTSEVLPTIRKTGGYVSNDDLFINTYLPFADEPTKLLFKTTLTTINQLNAKIEKDKPLVEFAGRVGDTSGLIDVGAFAKLLHKKNVDIGRTRLFAWLREQKYLRHNNEPYQKWIDSGIFQTREFTYMAQGQPCIGIKTYITGKGQTYLADKIGKMY